MSQVDAFLEDMLPRQLEAEIAIHNGDVAPRLATWSQNDPVTVFGAAVPCRSGWERVRATFDWVASRFVSCSEYDFELVAAGTSGDLAYTAGYENYDVVLNDGTFVHNRLRVTHVYRREDGVWKVVHRHGDHPPPEPS